MSNYLVTTRDKFRGLNQQVLVALSLLSLFSVLAASVVLHTAAADTPSTETVFTMAHVPDTQNETMVDGTPQMTDRYQWLADSKESLNLKFIAHTGDVTNWGVADTAQFVRTDAATNILDTSGVPYAYAIGNHDTAAVGIGGSAAPGNTRDNLRNTVLFNQTFPLSRFKNVAGVFEAGKVDNMFQIYQAGGVDWLVITHEMWPRQSVVDWMKQVAQAYPAHNIVVVTHAYVDGSGTLPTTGFYGDTNAPTEWNQFISQYPNIKMVLSGHYGPGATGIGAYYGTRTGVNGNKIAQVMTAYHSSNQNHVRLLKIDTANQTLSSTVYVNKSTSSSYPTGYITDAYSNFVETNMNWIGGGGGGTPQTVPSAPNGVVATPGLNSASVSFAAPISDGGSAVTSYTVTSSPGGLTASGSGSPITVNGLSNGTNYTFTVTATNATGTSTASAASASVTPYSNAPELLSDPGFEQGNGGWTPFVVGTFSRVQTPVRSGSNALRVAATSTAVNWVGMTQNSAITNSVASQRYTAQCYVQPSVAGRNMQIRLLEYTQNFSSYSSLGQASVTNIPAGSWTLVRVSGVALTAGKRIIPQIYATNQTTSTGTVTYDDCSIVAESSAPTIPSAPTGVAAVANNSSATVSFNAPSSNGNSPVTSYTVTSSPSGITANGTSSPIAVNGLTNGTNYSFTVTATNAVGTSTASIASNTVTPSTFPGAPLNLTGTVGDGTVALSWAAPSDNGGSAISDYEVWYRVTGNQSWNEYDDTIGVGTTATVTGLDPTMGYEFFVNAVNAVGSGAVSSTIATERFVVPTAPEPPQYVTANAVNSSAIVSFAAPSSTGYSPITSYTVTSYPDGIVATGTSSPTTVTGLTNGMVYSFTVTATNAVGTSPASLASNEVVPMTVPDPPTNVSANSGDTTATVSWLAPLNDGGSAVIDYLLWYRATGETIWLPYFDDIGTDTSTTVTGLVNTKSHEFYVAAVNAVGTGSNSNIVSAPAYQPLVLSAPTSPQNVTATASQGSAIVRFDSPSSDGNSPVTSYTVTSTPGGFTATGTSSPIVVTSLTNGIGYSFTVTATNTVGTSLQSEPSPNVTPLGLPSSPTNVVATAGNGTVTLGWNAPSETGGAPVTDYTIEYMANSSGIWVPYNDGASTGTSRILSLQNSTSYIFRVSATTSVGLGTPSLNSISVTPQAPVTTPSAPQNVSATAGATSAAVSFTAPASNGGALITSYIVTSTPGNISASGSGSPITINGLTNGTTYTFSVQAVNSAGTGTASAQSNAVTPNNSDLLPDPGYELGTTGGWTAFNVGTFSVVSTPVFSGSKALSVSTTATSSQLVGMTQNNAVSNSVAGKTYTFSCYIRPSVSGRNLTIRLLEYTQNYSSNIKLGSINRTNLSSSSWTQLQVTGVATASGKRIIPQIYATNQTASTGVVYYDSCSLKSN